MDFLQNIRETIIVDPTVQEYVSSGVGAAALFLGLFFVLYSGVAFLV